MKHRGLIFHWGCEVGGDEEFWCVEFPEDQGIGRKQVNMGEGINVF